MSQVLSPLPLPTRPQSKQGSPVLPTELPASLIGSTAATTLLALSSSTTHKPFPFLPSTENRAVRLVGGSSRCAGRVEVLEYGQWGSVCDDTWDLEDSHVVCRQLNCGWAVQALPGLHFTPGRGPIYRDQVNCSGAESYLWDCPGLPGDGYCGHKEDAGVVCSGQQAAAEPQPLPAARVQGRVAPAGARSGALGKVRPRQAIKALGKEARGRLGGASHPELEGQACPPPGGNHIRKESFSQ